MTAENRPAQSEASRARQEREQWIERFEAAWRAGEQPAIADYLPVGVAGRRALLIELVHTDLEVRLNGGEAARVEAYIERYPELALDRDVVLELLTAEYELRRRRELKLDLADYQRRFPAYAADLPRCLQTLQRPLTPPVPLDDPRQTGHPPVALETGDDLNRTGPSAAQDGSGDRNSSAPAVPSVPSIAGHEILRILGRGGMGVVYQARHLKLNRLVAVKMILSGGHADPEQLERFRAEARAVARLQHPNIVQIHEISEQDGRPYFSLEYVDGGSLDKKLAGTPLPAREAAQLLEVLARAMHAAHQRGIVHRDLKPANVLLTEDGQPKITDFGLAKHLDSEVGQTTTGAIMGTPSYMAPEQALGQVKQIGPSTDVYALGALLYEMLTGRPPFRAATVLDTLEQVRTQEPVPPRNLQSKVPRDLETICLKCLHKEPQKRYQGALVLAEDLHRFGNNLPVLARPIGIWERMVKWARRRPSVAAVAGLTLLAASLALVLGVVFVHQFGVRHQEALNALEDGRRRVNNNEYDEALSVLTHGRAQAERFPADHELAHEMAAEVQVARRGQAAHSLHVMVDRLRFQFDNETLAFPALQSLEAQCRAMWDARDLLQDPDPAAGKPSMPEQLRTDLRDLALLWADLRLRVASPRELDAARREVLERLAEAEESLGPTAVLCDEQQALAEALGLRDVARAARARAAQLPPRSAWEHYARGRSWMRSGKLPQASTEFASALALQPQGFWPNFYQGICAYRLGEHAEAVSAFRVCIALAPESAECYYNRGRAYAAGGHAGLALRDYDRALQLNPTLAAALLKRAILHYQQHRFAAALNDLNNALNCGADAAVVHYQLAIVHLAQKDQAVALDHLHSALRHRPGYPEAQELLNRIQLKR